MVMSATSLWDKAERVRAGANSVDYTLTPRRSRNLSALTWIVSESPYRYIASMRTVAVYALLLLSVFSAYGLVSSSDLALVGAKIYPSPTEPAMENGSLLIRDGHIVAVGPRSSVKV